MAEYIKSVRVRKKDSSGSGGFETETGLDIRVAIYDKAFSKRSVLGVDANIKEDPDKLNKIWPEVEYSGSRYEDLSNDEILLDYINTQSKLSGPMYSIIQDPWTPEPPIIRNFGYDPYYLNNGSEIKIEWLQKRDGEWSYTSGTSGTVPDAIDYLQNEPTGTSSVNNGDRYLVRSNPVGPNWSSLTYKNPIVEWNSSESKWIETEPKDKMSVYVTLEDVTFEYKEGKYDLPVGGSDWSDKSGNEMDMTSSDFLLKLGGGTPSNLRSNFKKQISSYHPKTGEMLVLSSNNDIVIRYSESPLIFGGETKDKDIIEQFISKWKTKIPNYDLKLCDPNNKKCEVIEYKSPLNPPVEAIPASPTSPASSPNDKPKLTVQLPNEFEVKQREDVPKFSIWFGTPPQTTAEGTVEETSSQFDFGADELTVGEEYIEDDFKAIEEVYTEPDVNVADEVAVPDDPDRGLSDGTDSGDETNSLNVAPSKPDSSKLKDIIKYACQSTYYPSGNKKSAGKCARFTFNHANNFIRALLKKDTQACKNPAGGNANQEGYFKALEKMGYKRVDNGTVTKKDLSKVLADKSKWNIGDVVCYWGVNPSPGDADKGGVKYGHTQIFTNGNHGTSNPWTSDNEGNFKCSFVYNGYKVDNWRFVIFKSPTSTLEGQKKYGVS